jgi:hypothetical protein
MMNQPKVCQKCERSPRRVLLLSAAGILILSGTFLLTLAVFRRSDNASFADAVTVQLANYEQPFDITKRTDNPPFTTKDVFVDWMLKHTDQDATFLQERWDLSEFLRRNGDA